MTTYETLMLPGLETTESQSMSSVADSRVRTSASPARAQAWQENGPDFGENSRELLATFDPATSSWKTSQHCFIEGLATFSETWPRSGMTRSGIAYQLPPLVRLTDATASGSWPTPTADACIGVAPTPKMAHRFRSKGSSGSFVEAVAARMWPTPTAGNEHWGGRLDEWGGSSNPFRGTEIGKLRINPCWVEELMGFPAGWTDCADLETP